MGFGLLGRSRPYHDPLLLLNLTDTTTAETRRRVRLRAARCGHGHVTRLDPRHAHALPLDEFFDRQWALAVLDRALSELEKEWTDAGKADEFARLKPWLTGDADHGDQAASARAFGMSEGALKVAVHRVRRRFRELVKAEIAQTLDAPDAVDDEMRQLFAALGASG